MALVTSGKKKSTLTHNLNQKLMNYQLPEKEAIRSKDRIYQDEVIVASFLAELPAVLASLESFSERKYLQR